MSNCWIHTAIHSTARPMIEGLGESNPQSTKSWRVEFALWPIDAGIQGPIGLLPTSQKRQKGILKLHTMYATTNKSRSLSFLEVLDWWDLTEVLHASGCVSLRRLCSQQHPLWRCAFVWYQSPVVSTVCIVSNVPSTKLKAYNCIVKKCDYGIIALGSILG